MDNLSEECPQEDDFESKLDVSFDDYILNLFLVNSER